MGLERRRYNDYVEHRGLPEWFYSHYAIFPKATAARIVSAVIDARAVKI